MIRNKFSLKIAEDELHNVVRLLRKEGDTAYLETEDGKDVLCTSASFISVALLVGNAQLVILKKVPTTFGQKSG